jgi:RNA polymerase sigma-70 factor (ECF subfamily)
MNGRWCRECGEWVGLEPPPMQMLTATQIAGIRVYHANAIDYASRCCHRLGGGGGGSWDAEDVVNDVFAKIIELPYTIPDSHLVGYIEKAIRHRVRDHLRRKRNTRVNDFSIFADHRLAGDVVAEAEEAKRLADVLAKLPQSMQKLLRLAYIEGYSHRRLAKELGVKPSDVNNGLVKARREYRKLLDASTKD